MSNFQNKRAPNGRPLSMLASSFSDTLDSAFLMSPEIESLSQSVAQKKEAVTSQQTELEELETKIKEMEARLREKTSSFKDDATSLSEDDVVDHKAGKRQDFDRVFASPSNGDRNLNDNPRRPPQFDPEEPYGSAKKAQASREKEFNSSARTPPTGHGRKQSTSSGAKRK